MEPVACCLGSGPGRRHWAWARFSSFHVRWTSFEDALMTAFCCSPRLTDLVSLSWTTFDGPCFWPWTAACLPPQDQDSRVSSDRPCFHTVLDDVQADLVFGLGRQLSLCALCSMENTVFSRRSLVLGNLSYLAICPLSPDTCLVSFSSSRT